MPRTARRKSPRPTLDPLELYRWAVQDPATQVECLRRIYAHYNAGRPPCHLREDFAGNSADAVHWIASGGESAVAVDLDEQSLQWAARRARRLLGHDLRKLTLFTGDVRRTIPPAVPRVDVIAALNFSALGLRARDEILEYGRAARRGLAAGGLLVLNVFGGPGAMRPKTDRHTVLRASLYPLEEPPPSFEYHWEQRSFDPITARIDCRIHFLLPEAGWGEAQQEIRDAFMYDWRLWTLPELSEILSDAGFSTVEVWHHDYDAAKSSVTFAPVHHLDGTDVWVAYVVGVRGRRASVQS